MSRHVGSVPPTVTEFSISPEQRAIQKIEAAATPKSEASRRRAAKAAQNPPSLSALQVPEYMGSGDPGSVAHKQVFVGGCLAS
jgi:hypothetical protein